MSLLFVLASFTSFADPVAGLKPGETVVELDSGHALALDHVLRSRILGANTGQPIEDVLVEAWTENGEEPRSIEQCLDRVRSNAGGQVEIDCTRTSVHATKIRLSKAGFASTTITPSDMVDQEVCLSPQAPLAGRVLDLAGKPVVGAIVRTRETCAHAVPASQTRTDSLGRFRLMDCPIGENDPEIEVLGELIAPLHHLDGGDLRKQAAFQGRLDLYVARRAPIDLRVVDAQGEPLANRRVVTNFAPMYESWTDKEGRCRMFPPEGDREATFYIADVGPKLTLLSHFVPDTVTTVTPILFESRPELPARVEIVYSGLDASVRPPKAIFISSAGTLFWIDDETSKLPVGAGRLLVGGRFGAYAPVDQPVELVSGENRVTVALTRNPLVRTKPPIAGGQRGVVVQAGADSTERSNPTDRESDMGYFVPRGEPITLFHEASDGEMRRVILPAITTDAEVDLTAPATIVRAGLGRAAEEKRTLVFSAADRKGQPIEGLEGRVYADSTSIDFAPAKDGKFSWELPAFSSYRVAFRAPGFTSVYVQGVVRGREDNPQMHVSMLRRAHLTLRGPITSVIVPGASPEVVDGAFEIDITPGPLTLRVLRENQPPLAIELTLADGEKRSLEVR